MKDRLLRSIKENGLIIPGDTVLAALSGGADSTALLLMLNDLHLEFGFGLAAAHFNHCIRKTTADRDEAFCAELCKKLSIPFFTEKQDVLSYASKTGLSIETAARIIRYDFLYEVYKKTGAASIATAHHADDNAESILMHIFRGSGLAGLCGIRPQSELELPSPRSGEQKRSFRLIRPLLEFKKSEIIEFLKNRKQLWCTDETNLEAGSARNILRLNIIPEIESGINSSVISNILRLSKIASEDEAYLSSLADEALETARMDGGYLAEKLIPLPYPVKKRAIRQALSESGALVDAEQTHIDALCELLNKQSGMGIDLPSARARMVFGRLVIEKAEKSTPDDKINRIASIPEKGENSEENGSKTGENPDFLLKTEEGVQKTPFGDIKISFFQTCAMENSEEKEYNSLIYSDLNTAFIDRDRLCGELTIRTRRPGDRFRPLNSAWRMKLKDFFISRNVDSKLRDSIPLLICQEDIVFIPGFLVSDDVKLTEKTKSVIKIEFLGMNDFGK
ncbi:MAG: tRNA lysidine(34) synthetase TilS [Clostridia bacterium]|nr:tRNA lysidine(34) synthetase TilS [Clostridia bacterium]